MSKPQLLLSLLLNLFVFLSVFACISAFFLRGGQGNMKERGAKALSYFTVDSNIFCAVSCLCAGLWELFALCGGGNSLLPRWLDLLCFTGTISVGLTFFTVLFYLLPITKFDFSLMYAGRNLFLHALCPLTAMGNWVLLERGKAFSLGWSLLGLLPPLLYGAVYLQMVLVKQKWKDYYGFNSNGKWYLSAFFMLLLNFAISAGLWALRFSV